MTTGGEDNGALCPPQLGGNTDDETMAREREREKKTICAEPDAASELEPEEDKPVLVLKVFYHLTK